MNKYSIYTLLAITAILSYAHPTIGEEVGNSTIPPASDSKSIRHWETVLREKELTPEEKTQIVDEIITSLHSPQGNEYIADAGGLLARLAAPVHCESLTELLLIPTTSEAARRALEAIPDSQATRSLIRGLESEHSEIIVGCLTSLGQRGNAEAIAAVGNALQFTEQIIVQAALQALGNLGTTASLEILLDYKPSNNPTRETWEHAILAGFSTNPEQLQSIDIEKFLQSFSNTIVRKSFFQLYLSNVSEEMTSDVVLSNSSDPSAEFHDVALAAIGYRGDSSFTIKYAELLVTLPTNSKSKLLASLARRGDNASETHVIHLALNEEEEYELRLQAMRVLASVGTMRSFSTLVESPPVIGELESILRDTLCRLRVDESSVYLLEKLKQAASNAPDEALSKTSVIRVIETTKCHDLYRAVPLLLTLSKSSERGISNASFKALATLAQQQDLPDLLTIVTDTKKKSTQRIAANTYVEIGLRVSISHATKLVAEVLSAQENMAQKEMFLSIIGRLGDDQGLALIKEQGLTSDDSKIKRAAVRALSLWPDQKPAPTLLNIIKESGPLDSPVKVLAFRGYLNVVRHIEVPKDRLAAIAQAQQLADDSDSKRQVLSALSDLDNIEAIFLAADYLKEGSGVKSESGMAISKIIERNPPSTVDEKLRTVLRAAAEAVPTEEARDNIRRHLSPFSSDNHLLVWDVSGPHTLADTYDARILFDHEFSPEKGEGKWQMMRGGNDPQQPWLFDLNRIYGPDKTFAVAYFKTWIRCPGDLPAVLHLGSDDGVKVWLNDDLIHQNFTFRPPNRHDDQVPFTLQRGTNELLVKVVQGTGGWGFVCGVAEKIQNQLKDTLVKGEGQFMVPLQFVEGNAAPPQEASPVWSTERWSGDPFTGEWRGVWVNEGNEQDVVAQVWATAFDEYAITIQEKFDQPYNPILKFELAGEGELLELNQNGWQGTLSRDHLLLQNNTTAKQLHLRPIERQSPTLGKAPPEGAVVLYNGTGTEEIIGEAGGTITWDILPNGVLQVRPKTGGIYSKQSFGDFKLHAEFRSPYSPGNAHQFYGNSGIFLQMAYEVQVLQSFGLTGTYDECGAFYKVRPPDVNACAPPLQWQTYDITFRAARFNDAEELTEPARATVIHNGITIHDNVALNKTTIPDKPPPSSPAPILIQDHHNQVQYRNLWVLPLLD